MTSVGVEASALGGQRTGVGRYTLELLAAASAWDDEMRLSAVVPHDRPLAPDVAERAGVESKLWPRGTYKVLWLADKLGIKVPFEFLAGRQDVMLYPNFRWFPTRSAATMTIIHDLGFRVVPECVHPDYLPRLRGYAEQAISQSDVIGAVSETVAEEIAEAYPDAGGRTVVLKPGQPGSIPVDAPSDWRDRLRELGLEPGFLLHVGTLEPRKNLTHLVDAILRLPADTMEQHPLVLVGPRGWQDEAIVTALHDAAGRVLHLDFVSDRDLRALYEGAELLVFPSRYEGFGLPILEAMQYRVPVACSDIPVLREVAGTAAAFFDHTDPEAIAATVTRLLSDDDERVRLAEAGSRRAGEFSWRETGRRFVDIVATLASGT